MNWTKEQKQAIDQRDTNILVAAAAGSGKTAVLVERIKKLIIEDGVPIDKMLIVTFTNAAASEMKEKIRLSINEMIEKDPENSQLLREQLSLLPRANISTFHAFALDVIRNFFFLCDVKPGFSICDDAQKVIIREDALDLLIDSEFAKNEQEFLQFLNWYSSDRNLQKIRDLVSKSYDVLQSLPYPWQWLSDKINDMNLDVDQFKKSKTMNYVWDIIDDAIEEIADLSYGVMDKLATNGLDRLAEIVKADWESYEDLKAKSKAKDFDGFAQAITSFKSATLKAKNDEKEDYGEISVSIGEIRKAITEKRKSLIDLFFSQDLSDQIEDIKKTYNQALVLEKLLHSFDSLFKAGKREQNLVDFNDVEHYCLDILANEQAAKYYIEKFDYIFIDEYQDTNILQDEIISKIKRENNLFMVGDIKQSIYKFRLAEPSIFRNKYEEYGESKNLSSVKIDLNTNYRSKPKILEEINNVFKDLMDDYGPAAMLYPGPVHPGQNDYTPELKIVDVDTAMECDEEIANLKAAELEALEIAKIIKENLGRTYYDTKAEKEKQIGLRDIVILMRSMKNQAEVFYNVLKEQKIAAYIDDSEGYFDTMEINVFMSLLSVIDNKYQDIPLISTLHSDIFGFSSEELAMIRAQFKETSYTESFISYSNSGNDSDLRKKCIDAIDKIDYWKKMCRAMPLPQFIWQLLIDTKFYIVMGAMPKGIQRQANLRELVDKAERFCESGQVSLYNFMKYIEAVKTRQVNIGQVKLVGENEELVRIMTIHKSKGLEFPMVIVAGLGKNLNYTKGNNIVSIHKDIGIGLSLASYEEHWKKQTLIQRIIEKQFHKEEVQEEVRVLYVALTRAKDILYMTGTVKSEEIYCKKKELSIPSDNSFLDMISGLSNVDIVSCRDLLIDESGNLDFIQNPIDKIILEGSLPHETKEKVYNKLNYKYPYETDQIIKSKYSVSELNKGESNAHRDKVDLAIPNFRRGKEKITGATRGTIYHGFMERLDFVKTSQLGISYIEEQAKSYIDNGIFLEEEVEAIDFSKIMDFFNSSIGQRCVKAASEGALIKEKPFTILEDISGEKVMVQGIIDCYFKEEDGIVLIDYKTNWIDPSKPVVEEKERIKDIYITQMKIYGSALEKATGIPVKEQLLYLFAIGETVYIPIETK